MRAGALLVTIVQLACLSSPPDSGPEPPPTCSSAFGEWESEAETVLEGILAVSPTVTADQTLLLYEYIGGAIGIAERDGPDEPFALGDMALVSAINSAESERNPTLSADGLTVWFTRGPIDGTEAYVSHRDDRDEPFPFAMPVTGFEGLGAEGPDWWDTGGEMVYSVSTEGNHELFSATCAAIDSCTPGELIDVGDAAHDWFPTIRGDGLELVYKQDGGGLIAARRDSPEEPFENYDPLDFAGDDPELSPDGRTLYFALAEQLYVTTRRCPGE